MSGTWIRQGGVIPHVCNQPTLYDGTIDTELVWVVGIGDIWRCDCGRQWIAMSSRSGLDEDGSNLYWARLDPNADQSKPFINDYISGGIATNPRPAPRWWERIAWWEVSAFISGWCLAMWVFR